MTNRHDVAIVGGGLVGLFSALYLARQGASVVVFEAGDPGAEASGANAGSLHLQIQYPEFVKFGEKWARDYASTLKFLAGSIDLWRGMSDDLGEDISVSTAGGIVVAKTDAPVHDDLGRTVELISNNLANRQALTLTTDALKTNATLSGKAHQISDALYQYWLTVTPDSDTENLTSLSVSAYIVIPETRAALANRSHRDAEINAPIPKTIRFEKPPAISIPNAGKDGLIGPLTITASRPGAGCLSPCSLLQTRANTDAIVFFLEHQAGHGMVRLAGENCRKRTAASLARNGEVLSFPIAKTTTNSGNWHETYEWDLASDVDTFYAIVVTNSDVARRLANHIDSLPARCSNSLRPGLKGAALQNWLTEFAIITSRAAQHIDWRAIQVQDIA